ncbi:MAG: decaprenyl-phosphate phosphoribosyltransferase [Desulfonatronovibrionaceae bacterium]
MNCKDVLELVRTHQYVKNLFVFLPGFFAFRLHEPAVFLDACVAFAVFSLVASSIYIFNDWYDRDEDRVHPEKHRRPIASGRVTQLQAFICLSFFLLAGLLLGYLAIPEILPFIAGYLLLNIAYTLRVKHRPILDVVFVSIGFVLRLFVGAQATGVSLSHWIIVMTFLLALFLALAKRRDDVLIFEDKKHQTRRVVDGYNLKFLDSAMVLTASIVILAYILWSISPSTVARLSSSNLFLTAIFVVLGILRYMQMAFVENKTGSPTKVLLKDFFIQATLAGWVGSFVWIFYVQ